MVDFSGFSPQVAAEMALYASDAEQLFRNIMQQAPTGRPLLPISAPSPAVEPTMARVNSVDWTPLGEIRCDDELNFLETLSSVFGLPPENYFYGYVLKRQTQDDFFVPGDILVMIRGTMQPQEWALNLAAFPAVKNMDHALAGQVPAGFYSIYQSMTLRNQYAQVMGPGDVQIAKIANAAPEVRVMVVAHSLGSAIATYLLAELAQKMTNPQGQLFSYLFASPRVGDQTFVDTFCNGGTGFKAVPNYNVVNFSRDIVPLVPSFDQSLLNGTASQKLYAIDAATVPAALLPANDPGSNHNAIYYAQMLSGNPNITPVISPRPTPALWTVTQMPGNDGSTPP